MKLERKLRWDPAAERFIDDETANRLLDYEHRAVDRLRGSEAAKTALISATRILCGRLGGRA